MTAPRRPRKSWLENLSAACLGEARQSTSPSPEHRSVRHGATFELTGIACEVAQEVQRNQIEPVLLLQRSRLATVP